MSGRVQDKVIVVTGAGSIGPGWGNGKAAAVLYAREGAKVVINDINSAAVEETAKLIRTEGGTVVAAGGDVSKSDDVQRLISLAIERFGRIDGLHNNVGIVEVGGPEELSEANWDRLIAVNLRSMYLTMKYALPHMVRAGRGAVINLSSIAAQRYIGYPSASYSASKGAIVQLTQNVAVQYAAKGVRANCVLPGLMDTPQIRAYVTSGYGGDAEQMIAKRNALCPSGAMGNAWDVAYASLFPASDEARYITGQTLVVDGGITARIA
jgi:NAD(P)-dependent dehydrogenase (short-subunit alcohol dehydrogenase family)